MRGEADTHKGSVGFMSAVCHIRCVCVRKSLRSCVGLSASLLHTFALAQCESVRASVSAVGHRIKEGRREISGLSSGKIGNR